MTSVMKHGREHLSFNSVRNEASRVALGGESWAFCYLHFHSFYFIFPRFAACVDTGTMSSIDLYEAMD